MSSLQKVKALKDNNGHWYVIPSELEDNFYKMLEEGEADEYDAFNKMFIGYMTGGGVNAIQLYAEAKELPQQTPQEEWGYFYKVRHLRKMMEGLPDDQFIACQVVATDGTAWSMWGYFCPQVPGGTISVLTFKHDELKTLPVDHI